MVLVNGPAAAMGREHIILWGRGRSHHHVANFAGPLSVKSVVRGEAEWRTSEGRFVVDGGSLLLLNRGQRYSITVEPGRGPVETLCVFFQNGYVESAWQPAAAALDHDVPPTAPGFYERLHRKQGSTAVLLSRLHRGLLGEAGPGWLADRVFEIARSLAEVHGTVQVERTRVPALKAATREEIFRRLHRGRQAIDARTAQAVRLEVAAREACLSTYHFQRLFKEVFGESPHEYGLRRRLERAARLLAETRLPVTEICLETGFQSLGSFSTLFRRRFGVSPREIRKIEEVPAMLPAS
jgi:AraC-like DNA-binding protein